jgi:hypothetical protein
MIGKMDSIRSRVATDALYASDGIVQTGSSVGNGRGICDAGYLRADKFKVTQNANDITSRGINLDHSWSNS